MGTVTPMNRPHDLARKRPAEVVPVAAWETLSVTYPHRWALVQEARRLADRGDIVILGPVVWRHERGQWEVRIRRLRPAPPRWRRPLLIGTGVFTVLGGLFAAGWWALNSLALVPGAVFLLLTLAAFIAYVASGRTSRSDGNVSVSVTTSVNVTVR